MPNWTKAVLAGVASVLVSGCQPAGSTVPASSDSAALSAHGHEITRDSAPDDVGRLLIVALENSDSQILAKLVASQHNRADTVRITQGRKQFQKVLDNADALAIAGWKLTFSSLKPGTAKVVSHSLEGEQAFVQIEGVNRQDNPVALTATLVREDGWWKVMPEIK